MGYKQFSYVKAHSGVLPQGEAPLKGRSPCSAAVPSRPPTSPR
jgi:hypothetical protein